MKQFLQKINHFEHYALWAFMFLFVFDYHFWEGNWKEAIMSTTIEVMVYMLVFYVNYCLLLPMLLKYRRHFLYTFCLVVFLLLYIFFIKKAGLESQFYEGGYWRNITSMVINFTLFWLLSTLFNYYKTSQVEREKQLLLKAEKLETEMRFLKNQISPHFIFNTLNNIYSLVQQGHANAAPMLAKLSTILRYILYDNSKEVVLLEKELEVIERYIELQLLRKPKSLNIDFYKEGNVNHLKISPLILLNFVENSFKHSNLEQSKDGWIKISCIIGENNQMEFLVENSKESSKMTANFDGLGNQNIKRQLELNYTDSHELKMKDSNGVFTAKLTLQLST